MLSGRSPKISNCLTWHQIKRIIENNVMLHDSCTMYMYDKQQQQSWNLISAEVEKVL